VKTFDVLRGVQLSVVFRGPRGIWCQIVRGFAMGDLRGVDHVDRYMSRLDGRAIDAALNDVFDGLKP